MIRKILLLLFSCFIIFLTWTAFMAAKGVYNKGYEYTETLPQAIYASTIYVLAYLSFWKLLEEFKKSE